MTGINIHYTGLPQSRADVAAANRHRDGQATQNQVLSESNQQALSETANILGVDVKLFYQVTLLSSSFSILMGTDRALTGLVRNCKLLLEVQNPPSAEQLTLVVCNWIRSHIPSKHSVAYFAEYEKISALNVTDGRHALHPQYAKPIAEGIAKLRNTHNGVEQQSLRQLTLF